MTDTTNRRDALKCLGVGAGTLFTLQGGVFSAFDLAEAQGNMGTPLFLQISDTHIGFNKDANPDVVGTLNRTIDMVNAMPTQPARATLRKSCALATVLPGWKMAEPATSMSAPASTTLATVS